MQFSPFPTKYRVAMLAGQRRALTSPAVPDHDHHPKPNMIPAEGELSPAALKLFNKIMSAIEIDHRKKFDNQVFMPSWQELPACKKSLIGAAIIDKGAGCCASLVANGLIADFMAPDFGLDPDGRTGWTAVHQAALNLNTDEMLSYLLGKEGYSADVRGDHERLCLKQVLPLNVALHKLRFERLEAFSASRDRSAPGLLKELYTMDTALEVVRLLALKTKEFKNEFFNYVKECKMVEVGALLMAAGEKLMPLFISEGEDNLAFHSFKEISSFLQAKKTNIDEFTKLEETVKLLEIYDKIGNQLSLYAGLRADYRSGMEVAALLKDAGFDEKPNMFPAEGELSPAESERFNKMMSATGCINPAEGESSSEEGTDDAFGQVYWAIEDDNPNSFSFRIRSQEWTESEKSEIGESIIHEVALRCASLVISGHTSGYLECDFGLDPDEWTAVHEAALDPYAVEMLRLLLEHGYSADVRGDHHQHHSFNEVLPLNVALNRLRFGRFCGLKTFLASPHRSAPGLLKKLYTLDREMESVRLLAVKTRELKHEFFNYAKEGKMVEVGALLLVASEKLLPISISEGEDDLDFNSFEEISRFLQAKYSVTDQFAELKETVKLLDIYHKIGNQLSASVALKENRRSGMEIVILLEAAGFGTKMCLQDFQDYYVNRSNNSSFELRFEPWSNLSISPYWWPELSSTSYLWRIASWKLEDETVPRVPCSKSQKPSMLTRHGEHLCDASWFRNVDSKYASLTPAMKSVNAMQNLNSRRCWVSISRFFSRGLRRL